MTDVKYIDGNPVCDVTARAALAEKADADDVDALDARVTALEAGGGRDVPNADTTRY